MDSYSSSLISRLESSEFSGLHALFVSHLRPLSTFISGEPKPKNFKNKSKDCNVPSFSSLTKQFFPFIDSALSILKKRFSNPPEWMSQCGDGSVEELFEIYRLCLDCLECMASKLNCTPITIPDFRVRIVRCFLRLKRFEDAERECFSLLESLKCLNTGSSKASKLEKRYLPSLVTGVNHGFANLVSEVVVTLVNCVSVRHSRDIDDYWRVISLVGEASPWFRVLDAGTYEKYNRLLLTFLQNSFLFLVRELLYFERTLVLQYCSTTLKLYKMSTMNDEIRKFAYRVCSRLFLQKDNSHTLIVNLLECILDFTAEKCKIGDTMEFFHLVAYCATKCIFINPNLCKAVADHLNKMAVVFFKELLPFGMILRLYASALYFNNCWWKLSKSSNIMFFLSNGDIFEHASALINELGSYFHITSQEKSISFWDEHSDSINQTHLPNHFNQACFGSRPKNEVDYMFFYLKALACLCEPLSEFVIVERKQTVPEGEDVSTRLYDIQDIFHQFCDVFVIYYRYTPGKLRDNEIDTTFFQVVVTAYTLSLRTKLNVQKSVDFIRHVISSEWIQLQGLKSIFASLYSLGITLYKYKQLQEASDALNLFYMASWTCVSHYCKMLFSETQGSCSDLSEAEVVDFINEACTKNVFALDVLYQCGSCKLKEIFLDCLKSWLAAAKLCKNLQVPVSLIKQWVMINCELHKDSDIVSDDPSLFCLLSSSVEVSKSLIETFLEQELQAYLEVKISSKFSHKMQMKIINILLNDVYIKKDSLLQKSKVLITKGRVLRANGFGALKECIQCLSEAISMIDDIFSQAIMRDISLYDQLAVAYCLRALCEQEAESNSERIFQDIEAALDLWLSIPILGDYSPDDQCDMAPENSIMLLYHIVDLLSLKGCTKYHESICKIIIRFSKWKHIPPEKIVALLWKYRRLSHALCFSPISDLFIINLSEHYGGVLKSMDFWINSMKGSEPLWVGFHLNFSLIASVVSPGSSLKSSLLTNDWINDAKKAGLNLISNVPVFSHSVFIASYLYHDLCKKLISNGRYIEALSYADKAFKLCKTLLKRYFTYEEQNQMYEGDSKSIQNPNFGLSNLQICRSMATKIWSFKSLPFDLEDCTLTPWSVLQCYLEISLQIGIIHEVIGNELAAEAAFLSGKNISYSHGLPLFAVTFSSALGKLYHNKQFWDLAKNEYYSAKQVLADNSGVIFCSKCKSILEVTLDLQLGDLCICHHDSLSLLCAEGLYKPALEKLNLFEWKDSVSFPVKSSAETQIQENNLPNEVQIVDTSVPCSETNNVSQEVLPQTKREARRSKKNQKSLKNTGFEEHCLVVDDNRRMTRSLYRASQVHDVDKLANKTSIVHVCTSNTNETVSGMGGGGVMSGSDQACICMNKKCWQCLSRGVADSGLLSNFIYLKWEFVRKWTSLRLLNSLGKCLGIRGEIHEMHKIFLEGITVLFNINALCDSASTVSVSFLFDLIGKEIPGDLLQVERAALIYNMCWFSLKIYHFKDERINCCFLSDIQLHRLVSWLMLAFTLCREVPLLFQKVSRLLVVIILYSISSGSSSISLFSSNKLSINYWASYFHQASLGTHLNNQLFSIVPPEQKCESHIDAKVSEVSGSSLIKMKTNLTSMFAPESCNRMEEFVEEFFQSLPCIPVLCISLLGGIYSSLLNELMGFPSSENAWMLVSRINLKNQPIVVLLPVDSISEEFPDGDTSGCSSVSSWLGKDPVKKWRCPWNSTIVDDVAPVYRHILEKNYLTCSTFPDDGIKGNKTLWWNHRKDLNQRLCKFLRSLEDSWFGHWKFLLMGKKDTDNVMKLMESVGLKNGVYIGRIEQLENARLPENAFDLIMEALDVLEDEPIILVLDSDVQMLPWESIPILRKQEVYRMPSMYSITAAIEKYRQRHQTGGRSNLMGFPLIDPLDAFYCLNPSGDLTSTQHTFENSFKNLNLEGKAGSVPSSEEWAMALKSHDLFIYLGHGNGSQYISVEEITRLENCAAALLMGCSSGALSVNGSFPPRGAPLCYLKAGSPVVVANLWEVTDKDIDRFAKAVLDAWLEERSKCSSHRDVVIKLGQPSVVGGGGMGGRRARMAASFMCEAREACVLPFLIGASPVCYGVPTAIWNKKC